MERIPSPKSKKTLPLQGRQLNCRVIIYFRSDFPTSEMEYTVKLHSPRPLRAGAVFMPTGGAGAGESQAKCI